MESRNNSNLTHSNIHGGKIKDHFQRFLNFIALEQESTDIGEKETMNSALSNRKNRIIAINGNHVDLDQVQSAIESIDGVKKVAVVYRKNNKGKMGIVAFWISDKQFELRNGPQLQNLLRGEVPEEAIPRRFIRLKKLPLRFNRKTNLPKLEKEKIINIVGKYGDLNPSATRVKSIVKSDPDSSGTTVNSDIKQPAIEDGKVSLSRLQKELGDDLVAIVSKVLNVPVDQVEHNESMTSFGFDSIRFTQLSGTISEKYNIKLSPAGFFELEPPTINSLVDYLLNKYEAGLLNHFQTRLKARDVDFTEKEVHIESIDDHQAEMKQDAVAIVGMSGVLPQSETLDEFWVNLREAKDLISEIPEDRLSGFPLKKEMKSVKWGGFVRDVDKFDPLFFGISPREAETMDPQQRLLLETAWKAVEDAGYKASSLAKSRTGVFVGISASDYSENILSSPAAAETHVATGSAHAISANRLSYLFNINGPSEAIDTACSSSLIAVHRALESVKAGECSMAICGGVHALLSPTLFVSANNAGMLSSDGRCKTFDERANGYVRGEGAGLIVIKPAIEAQKDGDHIYALILSSSENHGGKAASLTAPNANAQADLVMRAVRKSGIDSDTISYVETHGTGTALGDPVEINGLRLAFEQLSKYRARQQQKTCGLGSVKTNIGHLEPAAGIAGLLKVVLAMKHKTLPATVHFQTLNPHIELENSPFYIVKKTKQWQALVDSENRPIPRRAGISSFGFGGSNAHVILEEYPSSRSNNDELIQKNTENQEYQIIPLSAKTEKQLMIYAHDLSRFICGEHSYSLSQIAYTLQTGREMMEERLAIVVSGLTDLADKLKKTEAEGFLDRSMFRGKGVKDQLNDQPSIAKSTGSADYSSILSDKDKIHELAKQWAEGNTINWSLLYADNIPGRVSLPTYPFVKNRYWIPYQAPQANPIGSNIKTKALHPLIGINTSSLKEQNYSTWLTGEEFFLADHIVSKQKILPGVAHIEMARAAGGFATDKKVAKIKNLTWMRPFVAEKNDVCIQISLLPKQDSVDYVIYGIDGDNQRVPHSQGKIILENDPLPASDVQLPSINIEEIKARCHQSISSEECYRLHQETGLVHGRSFQLVKELFYNEMEAISKIELWEEQKSELADLALHPAIMDSALQTVMGLKQKEAVSGSPFIPFSLGEVVIYGPLTDSCFAYAKAIETPTSHDKKIKKLTIYISDRQGRVLVGMNDIIFRNLPGLESDAIKARKNDSDVLYFRETWKRSDVRGAENEDAKVLPDRILLFEKNDRLFSELTVGQEALDAKRMIISVKPGESFYHKNEHSFVVNPSREEDYFLLINTLSERNELPTRIVHGWALDESSKELEQQLNEAFYSILFLSQAIRRHDHLDSVKLIYLYTDEKTGVGIENQTNRSYNSLHAAVTGFARSASLESSEIEYRVIHRQPFSGRSVSLPTLLANEENGKDGFEVLYSGNKRYLKHRKECIPADQQDESKIGIDTSLMKEQGVYLITGALGGLGSILANYLAENFKARLLLLGRTAPNDEQMTRLDEIRKKRSDVLFLEADMSDKGAIDQAVQTAKVKWGKINGVFHCAGKIRDTLLTDKNKEDTAAVLTPKIQGTIFLDEATKNEDLDFMMLFSSLSSILGNQGQTDYAYANRFMDDFVKSREKLRRQGQRKGKTLSVNWPFWREGGMQIDRQTEMMMSTAAGFQPLSTSVGIEALNTALGIKDNQLIVIEGQASKIRKSLLQEKEQVKPAKKKSNSNLPNRPERSQLHQLIKEDLHKMASNILKIEVEDMESNHDLNDYGMESLTITEFSNVINNTFNLEVTPALFFELQKPSIDSLTEHLLTEFEEGFKEHYQIVDKSRPIFKSQSDNGGQTEKQAPILLPEAPDRNGIKDIAIIGMSGIFPGATDLDLFWQNIMEGKDLVTEIPLNHFDYRPWFDAESQGNGKSYCKYGTFIRDVDKFDAAFFDVSPREAEIMDPQMRKILEVTYATAEDAGYASRIYGTRTGVFVGSGFQDYLREISLTGNPIDPYEGTGNALTMLANRPSQFFDLQGPSLPVETACSSTLVATHLAVKSLQANECDMAFVSGVNLMLSPFRHIYFSSIGALSHSGRCHTFDRKADGFIFGEGAAAILLKPLQQAVTDGDRIHGVIKGSAINHGGSSPSVTAPNPRLQTQVVLDAWKDAAINPESISYIEAHGTGTELGDPVEINGLKAAFKKYTTKTSFCGIGSVKTNIGHLQAAAGIASIIKTVLSMKHKTIPIMPQFEELNPYINLKKSPFYINRDVQTWKPHNGFPRRAGVSSFGFGGAYAHVVLEEYKPIAKNRNLNDEPHVLTLSAKNKNSLKTKAKQIAAYLEKTKSGDHHSLADIAFTLQIGRESMDERLAFVTSDVNEAIVYLNQYLNNDLDNNQIFISSGSRQRQSNHLLVNGDEGKEFCRLVTENRNLQKMAQLWISNVDLDWKELYKDVTPHLLSLPTYPFEKNRYWFTEPGKSQHSLPTSHRIDADREDRSVDINRDANKAEQNNFMYYPDWVFEDQATTSNKSTKNRRKQKILVIWPIQHTGLENELRKAHAEDILTEIRFGPPNKTTDEQIIELDGAEHSTLGQRLGKIDAFDRIYFLAGIQAPGADSTQTVAAEEGVHTTTLNMLRVVRYLSENGYVNKKIEFRVVTNNVFRCGDSTVLKPYSAGLHGLSRTVSHEFPKWDVSCIDIDLVPRNQVLQKQELRSAVEWMVTGIDWKQIPDVAIRGNQKHVRRFLPIELPPVSKHPFKKEGIYFILGGTGNIGMSLAEYLAEAFLARLALVGRRKLDKNRQEKIRKIEEKGGKVLYIQADCADPVSMQNALQVTKEKFGKVNGVIHSAMELEGKSLTAMTDESFLKTLKSKTTGSLTLYNAFENERLDFMLFFSSIQSYLGDKTQANYAAGSTFTDSFVHYLNQVSRYPVKVINWGYWQLGLEKNPQMRKMISSFGYDFIAPDDGFEALKRIIACPANQIMAVKANKHVQERLGIETEHQSAYSNGRIPQIIGDVVHGINPSGNSKLKDTYEAYQLLEELVPILLLKNLRSEGVFVNQNEIYTLQALINKLAIIPKYKKQFDSTLEMLKTVGFIEIEEHSVSISKKHEKIISKLNTIDKDITALRTTNPAIEPYICLLEGCLESYPDIIAGRKEHMEVLFPGGSMELVNNIYKGNPFADYYNRMIALLAKEYVRQRLEKDPGALIRILEIGAGTGGTSSFALEALGEYEGYIEYSYSDISPAFLNYGRKEFGSKYPFVTFDLLNIEDSIRISKDDAKRADIILAGNVVHATRSINQTLNQIKKHLKTNGVLLMSEVTRLENAATLTFGLTDGWWIFDDESQRIKGSPLLSTAQWRQQLSNSGFKRISMMGYPGVPTEESSHTVIIAESDGICINESVFDSTKTNKEISHTSPPISTSALKPIMNQNLKGEVAAYIKSIFVEVLKADKTRFDDRSNIDSFGIDSLIAMEILNRFKADFGMLSSTLLYEHTSIAMLSEFFINEHPETIQTMFSKPVCIRSVSEKESWAKNQYEDTDETSYSTYSVKQRNNETSDENIHDLTEKQEIPWNHNAKNSDIAIIGIDGRFPDASSPDELWKNLEQGKNCITEIPRQRWNWEDYYKSENTGLGNSCSKWGGFLDDVDLFDPLLFNISPKDAEFIDPQERLFLESAWTVLEDAGYSKENLPTKSIGVFVGASNASYEFSGGESWLTNGGNWARSSFWSIANRISYFFDFQGPSMAIDTGCSSSLTAVHSACENILSGDCRMAIAGGVSLLLHPKHYVELSRAGFLSSEDTPRVFGKGADGFVLGEGVGSVLLKPLDEAIRNNDHIYAVIKGTAVNSDGRTVGYSSPNPNAQADLIQKALKKANLSARMINYVEAAANGADLGDTIEIAGLIQAFRRDSRENRYCSIASLKSNIGHLEAASGIAGMIKVILQMKYKKLVKSNHSQELNPKIEFQNSPFYVQQALAPWNRAIVEENGKAVECLRRAGISSFGAGGANAHVVLEEFESVESSCEETLVHQNIIILSATNLHTLKLYAKKLEQFLLDDKKMSSSTDATSEISIGDLAYTLQIGRSAMEERLVMIVESKDQLIDRLSEFCVGIENIENCFQGNIKSSDSSFNQFFSDQTQADVIQIVINNKEPVTLAQLWINGVDIKWELLYPHSSKPRRISLPTYPYNKQRCKILSFSDGSDDSSDQPIVQKDREDIPQKKAVTKAIHATSINLETVEKFVKEMISSETGIESKKLSVDDPWINFGIESVGALLIVRKQEEVFGHLPRTLFLECETISQLSSYLLQNHKEVLNKLLSSFIIDPAESELLEAQSECSTGTEKSTAKEKDISSIEIDKKTVNSFFKKLIARELKIPFRIVSSEASWDDIGLTQEASNRFAQQVDKLFQKSLNISFNNHNNIDDLSEHFIKLYPEKLSAVLNKVS